jgi:hypothetical protein
VRTSHRGVGRDLRFFVGKSPCGRRGIGLLLQWNRLCGVVDVNLEPLLAGGNRKPLIAELADHVKGLARRLLEREPQLIRGHLPLDLFADVRRRLEEAVGGHEPVERLVWPLEVVVADVVLEPALRVDEVGEHRATQKLVPQRLPKPLDLAQCLRVLGAAADVVDARLPQHLLELGLAAPHRVLTAVIGEHLLRLAVRRHRALESLHHERRLLMMCERVPDDKPTVVVHEHAGVQPHVPPKPKREDVRLPKLIRRRPLEAPRLVLPLLCQLRRLTEALVQQNPPDLLLRHTERRETSQYVTNPSSSPLGMIFLDRHHVFPFHRVGRCTCTARLRPP